MNTPVQDFIHSVARSACLHQYNGGNECICFSCSAKRLIDFMRSEPNMDAIKTHEINTLVAENRALIADMERMREQASGVTIMLSAKLKALNYYRAGLEHRRPAYVPARVRLEIAVCADVPQSDDDGRFIAHPGDYDCESNQWGAISILAANGNRLGIKPCEFDVLEWRDNDK